MYSGKLVFAQVMDHLPMHTFRRAVSRYGGNRYVKSFPCHSQFLCMAFAQLTYRESLRDIEVCLRAQRQKLYHLGIRSPVSRNTLANANKQRDWRIYAEVAHAFGPGGRFALRCGTGLEAQSYWSPPTVTFANGYHLARVAVDIETGAVEVLDYKVVHDCGPMLNTDIVEGQIIGGVAQGIGAALYEQVCYDGAGQPLNANLGDYAIPSACEMPRLDIAHMETPSALNPLGIKGVGEAGAISPPAAIANAVEDALAGFGVRIDRVPITPSYLLGRLRAGSGAHAAAAKSQAAESHAAAAKSQAAESHVVAAKSQSA